MMGEAVVAVCHNRTPPTLSSMLCPFSAQFPASCEWLPAPDADSRPSAKDWRERNVVTHGLWVKKMQVQHYRRFKVELDAHKAKSWTRHRLTTLLTAKR